MSWSVTFIGKAENVIKALEEHGTKLAETSKKEYDAALPHLVGLVKQNWNDSKSQVFDTVVKVSASGYGSPDGSSDYRQCTAHVEQLYGLIV